MLLLFLLVLLPTESSALLIELAFDRLPSQQGWAYSGTVPESDVFSVSDGILKMDGRGLGDTMARYKQSGVINPTQPFSLKTSLRIIDSENLAGDEISNNVFGIFINGQNFSVDLFWSTVPGSGKSWVSIMERWYSDTAHSRSISTWVNDTDFHDYFVDVTPGRRFKASIDGVIWAEGLTPDYLIGFNSILFQEDSRESEPFMEMRQFVFNQHPADQAVPEPATIILFISGISAIAAGRYKLARDGKK
jgi:hypothetical protein